MIRHHNFAYFACGTTGTPLIFLHGTGCNTEDWAGVLAGLPPEQRVVSVDFRGHGASGAASAPFTMADLANDVMALLDHLALPRAVLVGHSLGGMVALQVAAQAEARLAGLLLLEGWTRLSTSNAFGHARFYGKLPPAAVARIQQRAAATIARCAPADWAIFWRSVEQADAVPYLTRAQLPIIAAYGALGRTAESEARLLLPPNPCIELAWVADAGHYLPQEQPAAVAALCQRAAQWR